MHITVKSTVHRQLLIIGKRDGSITDATIPCAIICFSDILTDTCIYVHISIGIRLDPVAVKHLCHCAVFHLIKIKHTGITQILPLRNKSTDFKIFDDILIHSRFQRIIF